jgi:hypothetical protein
MAVFSPIAGPQMLGQPTNPAFIMPTDDVDPEEALKKLRQAATISPIMSAATPQPGALGTIGEKPATDMKPIVPAETSDKAPADEKSGKEKFHEHLQDLKDDERRLEYMQHQGMITPGQYVEHRGALEKEKQDYLQEHPWGSSESAHPGVFGKIGHVLGKIGNIAGDILAPTVMADIPGSDMNRAMQKQGALGQINLGSEIMSREAAARKPTDHMELEQLKNGAGEPLTTTEGYPVSRDKFTGKEFVTTPKGDVPLAEYMGAASQNASQAAPAAPTAGQAPAPVAMAPLASSNAPAGAFGTIPGAAPAAGGSSTPTAAPSTPTPSALSPIPGTAPAQQGGALGAIPTPAKGFAPAAPKPKVGSEEEQFVNQYLKENKLDDTADNRLTARQAYKEGPAVGDKEAQKYNNQIKNALKGTKVDASAYSVGPKDTLSQAKESLTAAQKAAAEDRAQKSAERVAGAPEAAQARKDAHTMGYAMDETGQLKYMSKADADAIHSTFEEMKSGEVNKDRQALRQLNDVQKNTSMYTKAAKDYQNANLSAVTRADDQARIHDILNKAGIADFKLKGLIDVDLPLISALSEGLSRESKSDAYLGLSPQGKALVDGYIRTMASIPAYQKALTGIGRTNKEMLDLELQNIANPSMDPRDISRKQAEFQENIDRATEGFPTNLPGLKTPKQVREETERPAQSNEPVNPFGNFDTSKLRNKKF